MKLSRRVNDASRGHTPKRRATINNPSWINNDVKQAIGRRQRAYETKRTNNEVTVAEYIEAKRQVKRIVKQEKRNKELNIARICKHNPKSLWKYPNCIIQAWKQMGKCTTAAAASRNSTRLV